MNLSRLLAWEVVAVHLLTGGLFATALTILLVNTELEDSWTWLPFLPLIALAWLGWAYEGWIIWRGTAALRRGDEQNQGPNT